MIPIGCGLLTVCFIAPGFVRTLSPVVFLFVLVGFAGAAINVNSYIMAV